MVSQLVVPQEFDVPLPELWGQPPSSEIAAHTPGRHLRLAGHAYLHQSPPFVVLKSKVCREYGDPYRGWSQTLAPGDPYRGWNQTLAPGDPYRSWSQTLAPGAHTQNHLPMDQPAASARSNLQRHPAVVPRAGRGDQSPGWEWSCVFGEGRENRAALGRRRHRQTDVCEVQRGPSLATAQPSGRCMDQCYCPHRPVGAVQ